MDTMIPVLRDFPELHLLAGKQVAHAQYKESKLRKPNGKSLFTWEVLNEAMRKSYKDWNDPIVCGRIGCGRPWTTDGRDLFYCAKCRKAYYCSILCQKQCVIVLCGPIV